MNQPTVYQWRNLARLRRLTAPGAGGLTTPRNPPNLYKTWTRQPVRHAFFARRTPRPARRASTVSVLVVAGSLLIYTLSPGSQVPGFTPKPRSTQQALQDGQKRGSCYQRKTGGAGEEEKGDTAVDAAQSNAWFNFATAFEKVSFASDVEWSELSDKIVDFILPEWSKPIPGYVRKLQRELSMAPGSLADEIWSDAHDPYLHPEIRYSAKVRVSNDLCDEEKEFLARRKYVASVTLAKYLGLAERDVHPDDVPVIAMCGSGGGLRALVAGAGSLLATTDDGLFDCVTYLSGVSGSTWLQTLYYSTITGCSVDRTIEHLKARLGIHIAYPPAAFSSLVSAPTNKCLLEGMVEKLMGDPNADFGLVDAYGLLLGARLLVPKGELGVNEKDFKLSNQREYVRYGQNPLPIYTAVRHEIPGLDASSPNDRDGISEEAKQKAKQEAWFQWFEVTPYEFFCEEFSAGIPTWAMGRKFKGGVDIPAEEGFHLPETRLPFLLGTFGSAFCATLSHYYHEIRPLLLSLGGFSAIDEMICGRNDDLSRVHPIDPAVLPNFAFGMEGRLPKTAPESIYGDEYIKLMDAGMSNNLPIYPLLRPGREVDVVIAFDASADIKTDNWLSVADGYARQRGVKGWPVGIGWPKATDPAAKTAKELEEAQSASPNQAEQKLTEAKVEQAVQRLNTGSEWPGKAAAAPREGDTGDGQPPAPAGAAGELGYCTVWVGTTQERTYEPPPPSKAIDDANSWRLMEPDAGLAIVYCPFLPNDKAPGVDPATSDYMSTWNFVYTPEQIDGVVALARANYGEARDQIRATVRAIYERKKKKRLEEEARIRHERYRRMMRLGIVGKLGEGDHFS